MGGGMMGWGGAVGGPFHWLWWLLIAAGIAVLVRWMIAPAHRAGEADASRALSILKERYARGEIDKVEFEARRRDLV